VTENQEEIEQIRERHERSALRCPAWKVGDSRAFDAATNADADRARLLAIADDLASKLQRITDPPIKRLSLEGGSMTMDLDAPEIARIMATAFWDTLDENKADNYVEMAFAKPEKPLRRVIVTVRKTFGRTPDELRQQAAEERDRERARADKAEAALAAAREKVKGLDVVAGDRYEPHGNLVDRSEVLAALGVEP
jgi:hypothetical protein